jgi:hypothetical protein
LDSPKALNAISQLLIHQHISGLILNTCTSPLHVLGLLFQGWY